MKKIFTIILLGSFALTSAAQSADADLVYSKARSFYESGRFDSCEVYSRRAISSGSGRTKNEAYKLLALSRLEQGDLEGAGTWVDRLLAYDPYYTPSINDPTRFIDMIDERKRIDSGITTASRQAESVDEAPVPVTLITEDLIRHSGAQTLQELLCLYVPGMSVAQGTEANIAMHGIAGLSQENILILQDGHRLNGQSTNAEAVGPRNALDKIQQIEVLRGPASSLYGNVALTAVVNIITRKGAMMNGTRISGLVGTRNTWGTSFTIGGGNNVVDLLGWGNVYASEGFKHQIGSSTLYSGAYNRRPSYDIGVKARWRDFSITFNSQRSKSVPYVNMMQVSESLNAMDFFNQSYEEKYDVPGNYNYDKYRNIKSNGPGITRTNHHLNVDYTHSFDNIELRASGFLSLEQTDFYNVMGDSVDVNSGALVMMMLSLTNSSLPSAEDMQNGVYAIKSLPGVIRYRNVFQTLDWENISFGGQVQLSAKYNLLGHGNIMFGGQYEHFALTDASLSLGGDKAYYSDSYASIATLAESVSGMTTMNDIFQDGMEDVYSCYVQVKHYFTDRFIFNGGLRYDHKVRFSDDRLNKLSPRASVIYKFNNGLSARASYNYSFVDAPYIYRACTVKLLSGGSGLAPERMMSYQVGVSYHRPGSKLSAEINGFYNHVEDLITINGKSEYLFTNAGKVKQIGVDGSVQYVSHRLIANGNVTWQRFMSANGFITMNSASLGMPKIMGNVMVAGAPYVGKGTGFFGAGKLWLRATVNVQGTTWYQQSDELATQFSALFYTIAKTQNADNTYKFDVFNKFIEVKPQVVVGLGLGYEWKHLDIDVTLKNITNNEYKIGSLLCDGVPHNGREVLGKLTFKF